MTSAQVPTLSVCIMVKNESALLPRALESLRGTTAEVIVGDTGSSDDTVEVARGLGFRVENIQASPENYSSMRNALHAHAAGDWVLWGDADFIFQCVALEELIARLRDVPARFDGLYVTVVDDVLGVEVAQLRLCRRGVRLRGRVHEEPVVIRAKLDSFRVSHARKESEFQRMTKASRYEKLLRAGLEDTPEHSCSYLLESALRRGALGEIEPLLARKPSWDAHDLSCLAMAYLQRRSFKEAERACLTGLKMQGNDPRLLTTLADTYAAAGKMQDAEAVYSDALAAGEDFSALQASGVLGYTREECTVLPRMAAAAFHAGRGKGSKAVALLREALTLCPKTVQRPAIERNIQRLRQAA
jgi:hypothetical protein